MTELQTGGAILMAYDKVIISDNIRGRRVSETRYNDEQPVIQLALAAAGIYRSADQGQSWTKVSNLMLDQFDDDGVVAKDQMEAVGSNLLAISDEKVFLSIDRGQSWAPLGDNTISAHFRKLAVIDNQIFTSDFDRHIYAGAGFLPTQLTRVSAASYSPLKVAPESIVSAFGVKLATDAQRASTLPLPTSLAGTRVMVKDSAGVER
ncbi:MAG TPA: hypothetical protein VKG02_08290, partial [Blastocatellia bacterium]|nr:hypothetical protein [Blastocatellia bacterium]